MSEDHEDYYPRICIHCDAKMGSVILEKTYYWNQAKQEYEPDNYEYEFVCPDCRNGVGEKLADGTHKWSTLIDFGIFPVRTSTQTAIEEVEE